MKPLPNANDFLPGPVLLLGAPGVGKGTQAQLLMAEFNIPQISTGDLLREHRKNHTELGLMAESLMNQGQLVPDELVNDMVADRLKQSDTQTGYVLDGYPRTLNQAEWLDEYITQDHGEAVRASDAAQGELPPRFRRERCRIDRSKRLSVPECILSRTPNIHSHFRRCQTR